SSHYSLITVAIPSVSPLLSDVINQIQLTEIQTIIVSAETLPIIFSASPNCASLKYVVLADGSGTIITDEQRDRANSLKLNLRSFEEIEEIGSENRMEYVLAEPEDTATIVFSSGTTSHLLFGRGYRSKCQSLKKGQLVKNSLWDMVVFNRVKSKFGGKVRVIVTGGGPISQPALDFLRITVGCQVIQVYGLTQCGGVVTMNVFYDYQSDGDDSQCGGPLPCNEIKLVDCLEKGYSVDDDPNPRGEIYVRGANVMRGYYKKPDETSQVIDADGWFRTGDIGMVLPNGTLRVVERKSWYESIDNDLITLFDFKEFENIQVIARGAFGEVSKAYWTAGEKTVALKTLYNSPELESDKSFNEFVNELIRSVDFHDNVIRFFGLSLDVDNHRYFMVLQYADGGNMRDYLRNNHKKLTWEDRIKMGINIANVREPLVQLKIALTSTPSKHDFLAFKKHTGSRRENDDNRFRFVEIRPSEFKFRGEVEKGVREKPVDGTPLDYCAIYVSAWSQEPSQRPDIERIREDLGKIRLSPVWDNNRPDCVPQNLDKLDNQAYTVQGYAPPPPHQAKPPIPSVSSFPSARSGKGGQVMPPTQRAASIPTNYHKNRDRDNAYPSMIHNSPSALMLPQSRPQQPNYVTPQAQNDAYNQNWYPQAHNYQQQTGYLNGMQLPMNTPYHNNNPQPLSQSQPHHYIPNHNPSTITTQQQQNYPNAPFLPNSSYTNDPQGGYYPMNSQETYVYSQQPPPPSSHQNYLSQSRPPPHSNVTPLLPGNPAYQPTYSISSAHPLSNQSDRRDHASRIAVDETKYPGRKPCSTILDKYIDNNQSLKDFVEPKRCNAAIHLGDGDVEGLWFHLDSGDGVNCSYDYSGFQEPLVHIAAAHLKGEKLINMLKSLKEYNADFKVKGKYNRTALHRLYENTRFRLGLKDEKKVDVYVRHMVEAINTLCECGCLINARDKNGRTVLSYFLAEKHDKPENRKPIIQALLDSGANPNLPCTVPREPPFQAPTALFLAIEYNWPTDIVELLMKKGADARIVDSDNMNILCLAVQKKNSDLAKWLLKHIYSLSEPESLKAATKINKSGWKRSMFIKWRGSKRKLAKDNNIENYPPKIDENEKSDANFETDNASSEQPWFIEDVKKKYEERAQRKDNDRRKSEDKKK
ncbi:9872_t:CDS:10, partial [Acaulospora colombiana]